MMNGIESSKEIVLLNDLLNRLEEPDFKLDAWKSHALILLERIFGNQSQKFRQVEKINYDYSSWSLRDTSGSSGNLESCKKLAKEIIQASIEELENYGARNIDDQIKSKQVIALEDIALIFEDELKGAQIKELKAILGSKDNLADKKSRLIGKIKEYGINTAPEILALILMNKKISQFL